MENKPIAIDNMLEELEKFSEKDLKYSDGHILGSMCTEPHLFAKEVFINFLNSNLGDPGLFKGTYEIEKTVIKSLGSLLSLEKSMWKYCYRWNRS
ncbi:MAG: hypothetical protein MJ209_01645 [archaeon]|nr:hypothetical protein [archaeon]